MDQGLTTQRAEFAREAVREPRLREQRDRAKEAYRVARDGAPRCPSCSTTCETKETQALKAEWTALTNAWARAARAKSAMIELFCPAEKAALDAAESSLRVEVKAHSEAEDRLRTAEQDLVIVKQRRPEDVPAATKARDGAGETEATTGHAHARAKAAAEKARHQLDAAFERACRIPEGSGAAPGS